MKTASVNCNGMNIAYRENGGTGPAVLLIHGNSSSSAAFAKQIEAPALKHLRLVAIDMPGHGQSARPSDPASGYALKTSAATLLAFMDALDLKSSVLVGWSLGGHYSLEIEPDLEAAKGILIFGTPPVGLPPAMDKAFLPNPVVNVGFSPNLTDADMQAYAGAFFKPGFATPQQFIDDIAASDGMARQAVAVSIGSGQYRDEVEVVAAMKRPLAVLHGEDEQLVNGAYFADLAMPTLWRGAVQVIKHAGHAPQWEQPETFNTLLAEFVSDCQ
jgi:pimeloyl-ACP methyl ester carboxylesterase